MGNTRFIMKRLTSVLLFLAITGQILWIYPALLAQKSAQAPTTAPSAYRKVDQRAFGVGEELYYDISVGFVTAGRAQMKIPSASTINNRSCYDIEFLVQSTSFFDALYKVRDRYESHLDMDGLFPHRFVQQIREGGYKRDFSASFDHARGTATTSEGTYRIEPYTQDILSAFYFMRTYDFSSFRPGQKVYLKNFYKDSSYVLTVKFLGRQTIKVDAGKFNCLLLEPITKEGGLFKSTGRVIVWVSDDERRVPVQVEAEIPVGSITAELTSYKGVAGPIRAKLN
jgi:hypothetical protein